jgi:hypothetical protein
MTALPQESFRNLRIIALVFLQGAPAGFDIDALDRRLAEVLGERNFEHITVEVELEDEHCASDFGRRGGETAMPKQVYENTCTYRLESR